MARILTSGETSVISSQTMERIGQHSVGFVRVLGQQGDAVIAGSGTLLTAAGNHAILTADHVLAEIQGGDETWLVICREGWTRLHRIRLEMRYLERVTVGKASYDENGPDLGLLKLASRDVATIASMQTFYNLDKRRERMLKGDNVSEYGWALFGMVHERTIDVNSAGTKFTRVKGFYGNVGFGTKPIERVAGDFDYLDFVALYNEKYEGPESYQGTSGGGLWQLEYRDLDGKIDVTEALLSGVAYFESARPADTRTIFCHGRRSIYEHVYAAMK